ncbi:phage tail fiber protein [Nitrolancea hollandica]|uniref:Uncharacterized protein n=1 Tax=Nitrolancea hollandica Lb TaxID=1129897 RepID=I4EG41_9BACT|nr:hypothetical protein [Nitrolancea hollandica]CCF83653.1 hypothetical protein NITHO_2520028 [Nitrolancea hollandica Lb]
MNIGWTEHARDAFLNAALRGQGGTITWPAGALYAAALTVNPQTLDVSDMVEVDSVTHPEYARVQVEFDAPVTEDIGGPPATNFRRKCDSTAEEIWPDADASWGTIVALAFFDAATGGNCWYVRAVATSKDIDEGDTLRAGAGKISISFLNAA